MDTLAHAMLARAEARGAPRTGFQGRKRRATTARGKSACAPEEWVAREAPSPAARGGRIARRAAALPCGPSPAGRPRRQGLAGSGPRPLASGVAPPRRPGSPGRRRRPQAPRLAALPSPPGWRLGRRSLRLSSDLAPPKCAYIFLASVGVRAAVLSVRGRNRRSHGAVSKSITFMRLEPSRLEAQGQPLQPGALSAFRAQDTSAARIGCLSAFSIP